MKSPSALMPSANILVMHHISAMNINASGVKLRNLNRNNAPNTIVSVAHPMRVPIDINDVSCFFTITST